MRLITLIFALSVFIQASLPQTFDVNLLTNPSAESNDGWNGYMELNGFSYSPPNSFLIRGNCWQIIDLSAYKSSINGGHLSISFGGVYATEEDS
ncbi:hypothetical protein K8I31_16285, partial [bacterium]|nr:hypothetical protein [bacterium]